MIRRYHVVAIPIRMVVNNFGDHNPDGQMYVLKENEAKVKELIRKNPFTPVELVQPLTIRANEGDVVEILFENQLPFAAGMHFQDLDYNVLTSDGANVGFNPSSLAECGEQLLYRLDATFEGICFFTDVGNVSSTEDGSSIQGLFGTLLVEKRGSWWTDPVTGGPINSGAFADIHHPFLPSFREYAWFFHDEMEVNDLTGNRPLNPMTNQEAESFHGVNYRYEPLHNRLKLVEEGVVSPEVEGEEVHHDSWMFGDPATPILRGYKGDPAVIRLIHAASKETHVFHYHVHQWLRDPGNVNSEIVDAQAISPQSHYSIRPLYGLGSLQGAIGDAIIHCHLYPHFEAGMWGMNRVFDTLQDGSQCYPNGEPIAPLQPLPDCPCPPRPTKERPGFPNFIPGKVGCKAPRPPLGIVGGREMTELERNAAVPNARPGAVFADPCMKNPVVEEFNISVIELPIVYNKQGWYDPKGRIYVRDEDLDDVLSGKKEPEPLVLHVAAGTCIRINYTNRLPHILDGDAFQLVTRTYETGFHIHFVKFDVLVGDGANVGWNYDSSVLPNETIRYEYFADTELKAFFVHDHLYPVSHQQHGIFGTVVVQPRFSQFLDSKTGEETDKGAEITVRHPLIADYRDFTLFVQDFAMLFDKDGCPIQPPQFPGSQDDPGIFAVNYRNEPLQFRLGKDCDPAYSFSSYVNGDPFTPVFRAYEGDSIRIRLLQGAQEESHSFNLHGLRWKSERPSNDSQIRSQQHIGISESFTFEMDIPRAGDYLWAFETEEDVWNGTWGLIRAYDQEVDHLISLSDRPLPEPRTRPLPEVTGKPPAPADPQSTLPPEVAHNAPIRRYSVVAFQTPILYNSFGDHDPFGIVFALEEDVDDILSGRKNPEPLVLRGNSGELVEVTLTSQLKFDLFPFPDGIHPYPPVKEQAFYPPSLRISLHVNMLDYDVTTSSGGTVGFNPDQTVGPGETITYRWHVQDSMGTCAMWDMADLRNHRSFGTFGAFIAEPRFTTYLDPYTLEPVQTGTNVLLQHPLNDRYREFVLVMHDGVRLEDKHGKVIIDPLDGVIPKPDPEDDEVDTYDFGSRGFNYRTERLINRFRKHPVLGDLFSSEIHGDPATPVFEAYPGDPVVVRLTTPSERRRSHTFHIHGHNWKFDPRDIDSRIDSFTGHMVVGVTEDLLLIGGAGGTYNYPGDYMYRAGNIRWDIEQGMWGIIRVHSKVQPHLPPLSH
ncbi:multicopper oxidase domain-containing protein [Domibacillus sp. DTU_2020_1001157_1_SI_ALB_TIR_016]|uniref:multicopper oxidase domain-containing protein n=1 Tax=Domibacillus sp. DTU_2020_1001157_1_SI_ALB_TIR_016 TaxID=3077789 RepID=UPI0028E7D9AC|nr:multicopper oxidase domain-containing protein [Domibacillus sp. DTU_2020_1001157_1_SI_ALB_TIR_016]WNS80355.1 multicopper oxidase domain-containing protein [Domibacillus sp. DTU_2020_1001157_1_SI_ALB_TIR_016]